MRATLTLTGLIACLLSLAMPQAARADGPSPLRQTAIAAELYARGSASKDPLLILAAARLRKSLDLQPLQGAALADDAEDQDPLAWEPMLAAALALVPEDSAIIALAADIAAESAKGVISGPVYRISPLGPGGEGRHPDLAFRGGEYAEVYLEAELDANLNLRVLDDQGRLVCADNLPSHIAYCGWTPAEDGSFTLVVENTGLRDTNYALITN